MNRYFGMLDVLTHFANHYQEGTITAEQVADVIRLLEPPEEEIAEPSSPIGETGRAESVQEEMLVARK